jgi:hypothetical protein
MIGGAVAWAAPDKTANQSKAKPINPNRGDLTRSI